MKHILATGFIVGVGMMIYGIIGWISVDREIVILSAKTKGYLKGYLAGNKEFAEWLKKNDPKMFKEIESY